VVNIAYIAVVTHGLPLHLLHLPHTFCPCPYWPPHVTPHGLPFTHIHGFTFTHCFTAHTRPIWFTLAHCSLVTNVATQLRTPHMVLCSAHALILPCWLLRLVVALRHLCPLRLLWLGSSIWLYSFLCPLHLRCAVTRYGFTADTHTPWLVYSYTFCAFGLPLPFLVPPHFYTCRLVIYLALPFGSWFLLPLYTHAVTRSLPLCCFTLLRLVYCAAAVGHARTVYAHTVRLLHLPCGLPRFVTVYLYYALVAAAQVTLVGSLRLFILRGYCQLPLVGLPFTGHTGLVRAFNTLPVTQLHTFLV